MEHFVMHEIFQSLGMYIVICMLVLHIEYKLIINQSGGWGCDGKHMYLSGQVFRLHNNCIQGYFRPM